MAKRWWTLVVVSAATFMILLDATIVTVVLPQIQSGLDTSFADAQWVVDAYSLTLAAMLLVGGSLADRFGYRKLFLVGLGVFTVSSLLCGVSSTPLMLILSRAAQGIGGSVMYATSLALLARNFTGKERGIAFGIWGAVTGIATGLGPVFGGLIASNISWRGIFLVNVPIGLLAILVTLRKVDEAPVRGRLRLDWPGFVLFTSGLVALIYGLIRAGETEWGNTDVVVWLCAAAVLLVAFLIVELRSSQPLFDLSLFRTPTFVGGSIAAFTMNGSLFAMLLYLVLYLQNGLGYSVLESSVRLLVISMCALVASTVAGRLSSRLPVKWLIGPGLLLVGVGLLLMSGNDASSSWTHLIPGFVVAGLGSGVVNPPLASTAVGVVTPDRSGAASGMNITFRQVGMAASIPVLGSLFTATLHDDVVRNLSAVPDLAGSAPRVAAAVEHGDVSGLGDSVPPGMRDEVATALHSGYASALNDLLVITGVVALVGAVFAFFLIRAKDFLAAKPPPPRDADVETGEPQPVK
ncbi:MFS transporter [Streptomyces sp. NPDC005865]|uniref:MFS transporter n=1 Tax=Streptomyces sp. NPDC005865 TaxID=3155453 RepID=UPI0034022DB4